VGAVVIPLVPFVTAGSIMGSGSKRARFFSSRYQSDLHPIEHLP
jgi:hypothetical protein